MSWIIKINSKLCPYKLKTPDIKHPDIDLWICEHPDLNGVRHSCFDKKDCPVLLNTEDNANG